MEREKKNIKNGIDLADAGECEKGKEKKESKEKSRICSELISFEYSTC